MGRDEQFTEYVDQRWSALVRTAVLLGCSLPEAEDLVQTALVRCYVAWTKVTAASDRDAYIYRVMLNAYRASRRRKWWGEHPTQTLPEVSEPDHTDHVHSRHALWRALNRLPTEHRRVVVLRYYAHLSERHVAEALGIPVGTVKSRLSRALASLARDDELIDLGGSS